jgi:hypothetical protein
MSHFFYLHKDLTGEPDAWKLGIALTPYSAVRARQKFCWNKFKLDHVYFGESYHIGVLESLLKRRLWRYCAKYVKHGSAQTEMFKLPIEDLMKEIELVIAERKLHIHKLDLPNGYSAAKMSECPLNLPSEAEASNYCRRLCEQRWKQT